MSNICRIIESNNYILFLLSEKHKKETMNLQEKFNHKWSSLKKSEKAALRVLIIFILGVMIFVLGTEIGKAFYMVFGK